jgi:hypothetical protein
LAFELCSFADRPDLGAKHVRAVGVRWLIQIMAGLDQLAAHCEHRSRGSDAVTLRLATVGTGDLGTDHLVIFHYVLLNDPSAVNFGFSFLVIQKMGLKSRKIVVSKAAFLVNKPAILLRPDGARLSLTSAPMLLNFCDKAPGAVHQLTKQSCNTGELNHDASKIGGGLGGSALRRQR